ncbi:MAG TPA: penicillin-binding protein [Terriglobia bacterium]|nr:penicillin-binding protein [Terriglobia bacterium]
MPRKPTRDSYHDPARPAVREPAGNSEPDPNLRRLFVLGGVFAFWIFIAFTRLYYLQVIQYVYWLKKADQQQQRVVELTPQRGAIFDRSMHRLAMSLPVDSVFAVPSQIPSRARAVRLLAPVLQLDPHELASRLDEFHSFCWIKRKVTTEEAERVRALNLKGVYFQKEMKRFYPKGTLAANVLGYVGMDDEGLAGVEYGMNSEIAGEPGRVMVTEDARRHFLRSIQGTGAPGKNVVLTIDQNIQYFAQKALSDAVAQHQALGGVAVVENPNTGAILAMASSPTFDPNHYRQSPQEARQNRGVSWVYEPGSVFKLVTVSAALEEGLTTPGEVIDCQEGGIVLAGHTIHDVEKMGFLSVADVLAKSSDVGTIKLSLRLGDARLYRYVLGYGFGSKTGIDLPGEERGLLKPPDRWSGISIGEISIGQEIGVTAVQIVSAYSAVANGGIYFKPRIVQDVFLGNEHDPVPPSEGHRVISAKTAEQMHQMLMGVVAHGTGTNAQIKGYTVGGKTGTAQKVDPDGRYSRTHHVASFVGIAPALKPRVVILVSVDSPVGQYYGAEVAAPVFKEIAQQTLAYLNVPQDDPGSLPRIAGNASRAVPAAEPGSVTGGKQAAGDAAGPRPGPIEPVSYNELQTAPHAATQVLNAGPEVAVPNFSGLAERRVAQECQGIGLDLQLNGSGLATQQDPPAGTRVPVGSRVTVEFGRWEQ